MTSENDDDDGYPYNKLRAVMFEAYHVLATDPNGAVKVLGEYERRQTSLRGIDEILEWRPLIQSSAATSSCSSCYSVTGASSRSKATRGRLSPTALRA